jgi:hypothetical protein
MNGGWNRWKDSLEMRELSRFGLISDWDCVMTLMIPHTLFLRSEDLCVFVQGFAYEHRHEHSLGCWRWKRHWELCIGWHDLYMDFAMDQGKFE